LELFTTSALVLLVPAIVTHGGISRLCDMSSYAYSIFFEIYNRLVPLFLPASFVPRPVQLWIPFSGTSVAREFKVGSVLVPNEILI